MDAGFGEGAGAGGSLLDGGGAGGMDGFGGLAAGGEQQAPADRFSALREADKEHKLSPKVLAWQEKQKERIAKKGYYYTTSCYYCTECITGWIMLHAHLHIVWSYLR